MRTGMVFCLARSRHTNPARDTGPQKSRLLRAGIIPAAQMRSHIWAVSISDQGRWHGSATDQGAEVGRLTMPQAPRAPAASGEGPGEGRGRVQVPARYTRP